MARKDTAATFQQRGHDRPLCGLSCCRGLVHPYQILNFPRSSGLKQVVHPGRYQNLNELNSHFDRCLA